MSASARPGSWCERVREPWLAAFIRAPSHPRFYGKLNEMDEFDPEWLSKAELAVLIGWLRAQADQGAGWPRAR